MTDSTSPIAPVEEDRPVLSPTAGGPAVGARRPGQRVVMMPIDDSPQSEYVIQWSKNNLLLNTDKVVLVFVRAAPSGLKSLLKSSSSSADNEKDVLATFAKADRAADSHAAELIRTAAKILQSATNGTVPLDVGGYVMAGTDPRECLLTKATSLHADVIVLGARSGRGQVARLLLGSTSDFLARNAPCPVVIVREPADDAGLARAHAKGGKVIATPTETVGQPLPFPARESGSKD